MACDFSYNHYRYFLKKALAEGFKITNFRDLSVGIRQIILRHDIDYSLQSAFKLARIEAEIGVKATYFIRVHGPYNIFQKENYKLLKEIEKFGHEIGLHFEAGTLGPTLGLNEVSLFLKEKEILEAVLGAKIESAAEHGEVPRPKDYWQHHFFTRVTKNKVGIKHYPQEKAYEKFHYLSDSCGRWREGCFCQNLSKYSDFQLLTHPVFWDPKQDSLEKDYAQIMEKNKNLLK